MGKSIIPQEWHKELEIAQSLGGNFIVSSDFCRPRQWVKLRLVDKFGTQKLYEMI